MKPKQERIVIDANNHYCTNINGLFNKLRTEDGSIILMENGFIKFLNFTWEEKDQVWQQIKNLRKKRKYGRRRKI